MKRKHSLLVVDDEPGIVESVYHISYLLSPRLRRPHGNLGGRGF